MFQCDYARRVFPCFDEPHVRSTFSLTLRIPDHLTAVSNSPLSSRTTDSVTAVCTFARTVSMPVFLFAFAVDRFESVKGATRRGLPVEVFARAGEAGLETVLAESIGAVEFFEGYLGVDLPIPTLQIISIASFKWHGMEHFGAIFFGSQFISLQLSPFARILLVHEIVHHWAGDITSPSDWRELWLSEGLATLLPMVYFDSLTSHGAAKLHHILDSDVLPGTRPVQPESYRSTEELFDLLLTYDKAALIQRMARAWLGADGFRAALSRLFQECFLGNADLFDVVRIYSAERNCEFMLGWLLQPGFPIIVLEDDGVLHQAPWSSSGEADSLRWIVPLGVQFGSADEVQNTQILVGPEPTPIAIDADWICLNWQAEAVCRVWHKGRWHDALVSAAREGRIGDTALERVRDDLAAVVQWGLAPNRHLAQLGGRRREGKMVRPTGKLAQFGIRW